MGSLHIDYRPRDLSEVVGNEKIVKIIESIFEREDKEDIPNTWLFCGPSGCGKTTLARIVSKMLGCSPVDTNQDYQEINASNTRGIDTAREIISSMKFKPMTPDSECRVYLIDEVHQGTKDFQNSLLKALEDTPKHVYFMLCTTDPQKLLKTIKTRSSIFEVQSLDKPELIELAEEVLESEGILEDVDEDVVEALVSSADGCPRQLLVNLDQIIDLEPDEMKDAINSLRESKQQTIELCRALLKDKWVDVSEVLSGLKEDPERVRQAVNGYMSSILLKQKNLDNDISKRAALVLDCFSENFYSNGRPGLVKACSDVFI